jgi:L-ribulose-5-phosphate 3-epimerase
MASRDDGESVRTRPRVSLVSKVLQDRSAEEVIDVAGRCGYDGVEWFCLPHQLPVETPAARVRDLAARTRDRGLGTACLSTYVGGFADLPDDACERQLEDFRRYVGFAGAFECPLLRLWPDNMGRTLREPVSEETLERAAGYVQQAADIAGASGRRVAVEMHLTIGADAALVSRLLDLVDRANMGVIYDPANVYLARRPHRLAEILAAAPGLAGRILHVQLKDGDLDRPTPVAFQGEPTLRFGGDFDLLLGEGKVDLRGAIGDLVAAGYDGWYSVETHALPRQGMDSPAIAANEIQTLRALLERV